MVAEVEVHAREELRVSMCMLERESRGVIEQRDGLFDECV